jgi:hypothetical protein
MSANSTNRADVRAEILTNLTTYLSRANLSASDIGYDAGAFQNRNVVVLLRDAGSERTNRFLGAVPADVWFYYAVEVYVALAEPAPLVWTNERVENQLAEIEKYISDFLTDAMRGTHYDKIEHAARTTIRSAVIQSRRFRVESIPIRARRIQG